jgi:2-polyprenyl-3-methyl-5-hydroxy-6-metoxy-1,4-benzoquinol methylase
MVLNAALLAGWALNWHAMAAASKWQAYYTRGMLPWDSGKVSSQLAFYICTCIQPQQHSIRKDSATVVSSSTGNSSLICPVPADASMQLHICSSCASRKPAARSSVLEIGCGTGGSAIWLAQQGFRVTAIDIIQEALDQAANAAANASLCSNNPKFILHDVMKLHELGRSCYDMIYDCQVYHALLKDVPDAQVQLPQLLFDTLKPGGFLFLLTGNANEPEIGPSVLTAEQLLNPLLQVGFQVVMLHQSRFDSTAYYAQVLGKRPLAWWLVAQRPLST